MFIFTSKNIQHLLFFLPLSKTFQFFHIVSKTLSRGWRVFLSSLCSLLTAALFTVRQRTHNTGTYNDTSQTIQRISHVFDFRVHLCVLQKSRSSIFSPYCDSWCYLQHVENIPHLWDKDTTANECIDKYQKCIGVTEKLKNIYKSVQGSASERLFGSDVSAGHTVLFFL